MSTTTGHATTLAALHLTRPYNWRDDAACREIDPETFFPVAHTNGWRKQTQAAKAVCNGCPVRLECLEWALDTGQSAGVWGGTSERERRALRGDVESQTHRCMNRQVWIEKQIAAGRSQREIALKLRVSRQTLCRVLLQFEAERESSAGEVRAA